MTAEAPRAPEFRGEMAEFGGEMARMRAEVIEQIARSQVRVQVTTICSMIGLTGLVFAAERFAG